MTIKELSAIFKKELNNQYPLSEIESFIIIVIKAILSYKHHDLYLHANEVLTEKQQEQIYNIIEQLKQNRPIQYIIGNTEFYDLKFLVDDSVLIPRPETEELVKWVLDENLNCSDRIIDIGTGSGCIAVVLAKILPNAKVFGIDISEDALATAKKNSILNEVNVDFRKIDILSNSLPDIGKFKIIVSNPPYITRDQKTVMEKNVLDYEPHIALFVPGDDPLLYYKAILQFAKKALSTEGSVYLEINSEIADLTEDYLTNSGFYTEMRKDINGRLRMIKAIFQ